jgi:hypothetical protein
MKKPHIPPLAPPHGESWQEGCINLEREISTTDIVGNRPPIR